MDLLALRIRAARRRRAAAAGAAEAADTDRATALATAAGVGGSAGPGRADFRGSDGVARLPGTPGGGSGVGVSFGGTARWDVGVAGGGGRGAAGTVGTPGRRAWMGVEAAAAAAAAEVRDEVILELLTRCENGACHGEREGGRGGDEGASGRVRFGAAERGKLRVIRQDRRREGWGWGWGWGRRDSGWLSCGHRSARPLLIFSDQRGLIAVPNLLHDLLRPPALLSLLLQGCSLWIQCQIAPFPIDGF